MATTRTALKRRRRSAQAEAEAWRNTFETSFDFFGDAKLPLLTGYQVSPDVAGRYLALKLICGSETVEIAIEHDALPRLITELAQANETMHARRTEPRN